MSLIVMYNLKTISNKINKYFKNIHNSMNQYFTNDRRLMLHIMDKRPIQNAKSTNGF